jgi:hypothetical protein
MVLRPPHGASVRRHPTMVVAASVSLLPLSPHWRWEGVISIPLLLDVIWSSWSLHSLWIVIVCVRRL